MINIVLRNVRYVMFNKHLNNDVPKLQTKTLSRYFDLDTILKSGDPTKLISIAVRP